VNKIRPLEREKHIKIAECYNDSNSSNQNIQMCIDEASAPTNYILEVVNDELKMFNDRQKRCYMTCNDDIREINSSGAVQMLNNCFNACLEKHLALLKTIQYDAMLKKIDEVSNEIVK